MFKTSFYSTIIILLSGLYVGNAQNKINLGELHGDFQSDFQTYNTNAAINAVPVPEKSGSNSFLNLNYYRDNITAGVRLEGYYPAMQGFDRRYKDGGVPFRFIGFKQHGIEVTAGNFYEQFGNGLTLRTYWEWGLGYDNSFDGFRVRYVGLKGLVLKGLIGQQRFYFDKSPGIVRGFDAEVFLNDLIPAWDSAATRISLGGSFVSKFQSDNDPLLTLPENVSNSGGRINITRKTLNLSAEYAHKINDPTEINQNIYKDGEAVWVSTSYSPSNFGIVAQFKRIDNMNFRSSRAATLNDLMINYLPAGTPQHTYRLATIYPYATQPNGEIGFQLDVMYNFSPGTTFGGQYGTKIALNIAIVNNIRRTPIDSATIAKEPNANFLGYTASLSDDLGLNGNELRFGAGKLYRNVSIEINKKINDKWKLNTAVIYIEMDNNVLRLSPYTKKIYASILVADLAFKIKAKKIIRTEIQHLASAQDYGNWLTFLGEYSIGHKWFFSVLNDFNYGYIDNKSSEIEELFKTPTPYLSGTIGYNNKTTRISLSYGRRRAGVLCVGGVCRLVPATDGLTLSVSSSF